MDDRIFDEKSAREWIGTIESEKARVREQDIYPRLRYWVDCHAPKEILEIGSGQGACSEKINLEGREYVGVEPSPFLLRRARKLYPQRHFVAGSAYELPFADANFDAVYSVAVWHLLGDLKTAARELSRVLRSQGRFLIVTANPYAYASWTDSYPEAKLEGRRFEGIQRFGDGSISRDVLYLYSLDEIQDSLAMAGLEVSTTEVFREKWMAMEGKKIA